MPVESKTKTWSRRGASGNAPRHDRAQFGMDRRGRHCAGTDGMMRVTHFESLRQIIRNNERCRHQVGREFMLAGTVGADGGDETTGIDIGATHDR
jgi:hypothetical protein